MADPDTPPLKVVSLGERRKDGIPPRPGSIPRGPVTKKPFQLGECRHEYVDIDEDLPDLTCANCGKQVDPYWYLRKLSRDWDKLWNEIRYARDEAQRLLDKAKRETGPKFRRRRVIQVSIEEGANVLVLECDHTIRLHKGAPVPERAACYVCCGGSQP